MDSTVFLGSAFFSLAEKPLSGHEIPSRVLFPLTHSHRPTDRRQHEISAIKLLIFINPALTAKESTARGKLSQSVKLFALVRASRMKFIADFMDLRFYGASLMKLRALDVWKWVSGHLLASFFLPMIWIYQSLMNNPPPPPPTSPSLSPHFCVFVMRQAPLEMGG